MGTLSITELYDLLSLKLGRVTAGQMTVYIEEKIKEEVVSTSVSFATKEDVARLDMKISETKSELIKWMFLFWVAQIASTFGFVWLFVKK